MSKPKLPGVDQKALEALARQFPSNIVGTTPSQPITTPETKPMPAEIPAKATAAVPEPPKTIVVTGSPATAPGIAAALGKASIAAAEPARTTPATTTTTTTPVAARSDATVKPPVPPAAAKPAGSDTSPPIGEPARAAAAAPIAAPKAAMSDGPPRPPTGSTEAKAAPPPAPPPVVATAARPSGGGRGIATVALLAAVAALVIAGTVVAPPSAIEWVKEQTGSNRAIDLLTERRATIEARFAADAAAREGLEAQVKAAMARLEAIEAVGGSSQAAAKRIDALEAAVNGLSARIAAHDETARALLASLGTVQGRVGEFDAAVKATGHQIATLGDAQQRALNELSASLEAIKKADRRPERLYLAAMQLRTATQTSGRFAKELAAVSPLAGPGDEMSAALRLLGTRAQSGVPTVADLRASFAKHVAPRLAATAPAPKDTVAERGSAWIRSMFASGQGRSSGGNRNANAVAAAERSLAEGQLAAAIDQLLLLEGSAALIASEWLREATARLAVDRATATVAAQAFEQLSAMP